MADKPEAAILIDQALALGYGDLFDAATSLSSAAFIACFQARIPLESVIEVARETYLKCEQLKVRRG